MATMRGLFILLCIGLACFNAKEFTSEDMFLAFKLEFGKEYATQQEEQMRYKIFVQNLQKIQLLNSREEATYGITRFADLTEEQFASQYRIGVNLPNNWEQVMNTHRAPNLSKNTIKAIPDSFDWRTQGAVTRVKDQASCGSCWAFSTIGNIEGQWFLAKNPLTEFSEEQLVDCDFNNCACFGGWPVNAYKYIMQVGGVLPESKYGYCVPPHGNCYPCMSDKNVSFCGPPPEYCNTTCHFKLQDVGVKISKYITIPKEEDQIAAYLVQQGPLSVLLNANSLQLYHHGVLDPLFCNPTSLDHAVTLIGYGIDGKKPYWLVKNSWGEKWGEKGYFRMYRGKGKCGINTSVSSAII